MRKEAYKKHKNAIKSVRGLVNNTEPPKFTFLSKNLKGKQLAKGI